MLDKMRDCKCAMLYNAIGAESGVDFDGFETTKTMNVGKESVLLWSSSQVQREDGQAECMLGDGEVWTKSTCRP